MICQVFYRANYVCKWRVITPDFYEQAFDNRDQALRYAFLYAYNRNSIIHVSNEQNQHIATIKPKVK